MQIQQATELFNKIKEELVCKYPQLAQWEGPFFSRKMTRALGIAKRSMSGKIKQIWLSQKIIELNEKISSFEQQLEDTIRHEFAHALDWEVFKSWGHGKTWKKACGMVGANPERYFIGEKVLVACHKYKYALRTRNEGTIHKYFKTLPSYNEWCNALKDCLDKGLSIFETIEVVDLKTGRSFSFQ
jgi:predicted SprT family Zn-dependent metalloprotease